MGLALDAIAFISIIVLAIASVIQSRTIKTLSGQQHCPDNDAHVEDIGEQGKRTE